MPKLTKRDICLVKTDGPTLVIEKFCIYKMFYNNLLEQKANKHLQTAAGIFNQLKDRVVAAIEQEPTPG